MIKFWITKSNWEHRVTFLINAINNVNRQTDRLEILKSPACLAGRLYVANIFLWTGIKMLSNWYTTLYLFQSTHSTPFLNHEIVAILVTFSSVALSLLLAFCLYSRVAAAGLFILNLIGVTNLSGATESELYMQYIWGVILLILIVKSDEFTNLENLFKKTRNL